MELKKDLQVLLQDSYVVINELHRTADMTVVKKDLLRQSNLAKDRLKGLGNHFHEIVNSFETRAAAMVDKITTCKMETLDTHSNELMQCLEYLSKMCVIAEDLLKLQDFSSNTQDFAPKLKQELANGLKDCKELQLIDYNMFTSVDLDIDTSWLFQTPLVNIISKSPQNNLESKLCSLGFKQVQSLKDETPQVGKQQAQLESGFNSTPPFPSQTFSSSGNSMLSTLSTIPEIVEEELPSYNIVNFNTDKIKKRHSITKQGVTVSGSDCGTGLVERGQGLRPPGTSSILSITSASSFPTSAHAVVKDEISSPSSLPAKCKPHFTIKLPTAVALPVKGQSQSLGSESSSRSGQNEWSMDKVGPDMIVASSLSDPNGLESRKKTAPQGAHSFTNKQSLFSSQDVSVISISGESQYNSTPTDFDHSGKDSARLSSNLPVLQTPPKNVASKEDSTLNVSEKVQRLSLKQMSPIGSNENAGPDSQSLHKSPCVTTVIPIMGPQGDSNLKKTKTVKSQLIGSYEKELSRKESTERVNVDRSGLSQTEVSINNLQIYSPAEPLPFVLPAYSMRLHDSRARPVDMQFNVESVLSWNRFGLAEVKAVFVENITGGTSTHFEFPIGCCLLRNGHLVVADTGTNTVKVMYGNDLKRTIGKYDGIKFVRPAALVADTYDNIYVKDDLCVQIFSSEGRLLKSIGTAVFKSPYGLALADTPGTGPALFVLDALHGNPKVYCYLIREDKLVTCSYEPLLRHRTPNSKLRFFAVHNGVMLASDLGASTMYLSTIDGQTIRIFGNLGNGPGEFVEPSGVVADAGGNWLVGDSKNNRVQIFNNRGDFMAMINFSTPIRRPSGLHLSSDGHLHLTLQTARPDVWLGLLHTPAHPFSSTTQLRSGTVPDTPHMSRS
ncbi:tripartite motif-containing protein 3-like [Plakobranchus ocellatus]|uniref:Tripartite motif-containing protein 3-like n=1 Tax=Plakobranchus ocellatus TaxID=259542 RepID=A0AAV4AKL8_9GAST|nr:tripartite motif-containing protein 3-like [Plakobranchus ocellatus]